MKNVLLSGALFAMAILVFGSCKTGTPTDASKQLPPINNSHKPPATPVFVKATAKSPTVIEITWKDTSYRAAGFIIERESFADSLWRLLDSAIGGITQYEDVGLLCSSSYAYRISAYNSIGLSGKSIPSAATTPFDSVVFQSVRSRETLYSVAYFDNATGIIVGSNGILLRTTNSGAHWDTLTHVTTSDLRSVAIDSGNTAIAVGSAGTILKSTNQGSTWFSQTSWTTKGLMSVAYLGSTEWVAVGSSGVILRTSDGGNNWLQMTSGLTTNLNAVAFANADVGVTIGLNGSVLWSTDGGIDWVKQNSTTNFTLYAVCMSGPDVATIVGDNGTILRTIDGGSNWNTLNAGIFSGLFAVVFIDSLHGFISGSVGGLLHTSDGGTNWVRQTLTQQNQMQSICARPGDAVTMVGILGAIVRIITCNGF